MFHALGHVLSDLAVSVRCILKPLKCMLWSGAGRGDERHHPAALSIYCCFEDKNLPVALVADRCFEDKNLPVALVAQHPMGIFLQFFSSKSDMYPLIELHHYYLDTADPHTNGT